MWDTTQGFPRLDAYNTERAGDREGLCGQEITTDEKMHIKQVLRKLTPPPLFTLKSSAVLDGAGAKCGSTHPHW